MKRPLFYFVILVALLLGTSARSQNLGIKTNLVYDATASINLGMEVGLAPRWTLDISGSYNDWNMSEHRRWKHWFIQPEARYWFCDRFIGHFLGFHTHGGRYNLAKLDLGLSLLGTDFSKLADDRYQGWFLGAGVGYGYSWALARHWSLEAEIGLGYSYTRYDVYPCAHCGTKLEEDKAHHYFGVTKAAVNLVYMF